MKVTNTAFGLPLKTIKELEAVFSQIPAIEKVIIYGSRAMKTHRVNSDIDLTIVAPSLDSAELSQIEVTIDDLLLPYTIDLSLFHNIENPDLVEHIKQVGLDFYKRKG